MDAPKPIRQHPPVRWPDRRKGPWSLAFHWLEVDGRYECVGLEIWRGIEPWREYKDAARSLEFVESFRPIPGMDPEAVAASDLRDVPFATLIAEARREVVKVHDETVSVAAAAGREEIVERLRVIGEKFVPAKREGGRGRPRIYGREHFEQVAAVYAEAWRKGRTDPRQAVAEHFQTTPTTAAKWITRARKDGLLPPTKPGRAGWVKKPPTKRKGRA